MTLNVELCSDELLAMAEVDSALEGQVRRSETIVRQFCEKFGVGRVMVDVTYENGHPEPLYIFADNLGGYTIEGIRRSLESQ